MKTIGLLHPGAMGSVVGATIRNSGYEVLWVSTGRSEATRQRAQSADLTEVVSLAELSERSDLIVSVCPPHAAEAVADELLATGFQGAYLDANAISPRKTRRIGGKMSSAGIAYFDGGIIGLPPQRRDQSWLYVSGPQATKLLSLFADGPLECEVVGEEIGQASALKMCFAANTKGTTALLTAIQGAAEAMGVRTALEKQWSRHGSDFAHSAQRRAIRVSHNKAWRFVGEMEEMVDTYGDIDIPNGFFEAAADVYRRVAHFKDASDEPSIEDVLAAVNQSNS